MKKPLLLRLDHEGHLTEASDPLPRFEGWECAHVVRATTLDGEPVCAPGCRQRERPDRTPVRIRDEVVRLTCLETPSGYAIWLEPTEACAQLTPREREVLEQVALGHTTDRIARRLGIRPATVRTHVEHARDKLGCATRAEAVLKAFKGGQIG